MRRRENAAVAEGAGPELARTVHPADDAAGGQVVCDLLDERRLIQFCDVVTILACCPRQLGRVDRRPPEWMVRTSRSALWK
jgi:hypothetical protein